MKHKRQKKSHLTSASDVLQSLLQNSKSPLATQFKRWRLWRFWPEIVGDTLARHTTPVGYSKGVLYVWVKNSVRLQELLFFAVPLRDKINEYLGYKWVKCVRFTLDRKSVPELEMTNPTEKGLFKK